MGVYFSWGDGINRTESHSNGVLFFILIYLFYLFIFGSVGSSLLRMGFL